MINNELENTKEEYINLLNYSKGVILLENKNLKEYANMHPESIYIFTDLIEKALLAEYRDGYQIIKTETYESGVCYNSFELKVQPNIYEKLKKDIFEFAYICCSNLVKEDSKSFWIVRERNLKNTFQESEKIWRYKGNFHAVLPSRVEGYNIKLSYLKANEEEYQEQYQQFLIANPTKDKTKTLKRNNN